MEIDAKKIEELCERLEKRREHYNNFMFQTIPADDDALLAASTIRSLLLRVEAEKQAREEAAEDVRSLCRFILSEWGPGGAFKATTYSLEQRKARSAKGGDANDSGPSRPLDATSPGVTAGASALTAKEKANDRD